MSRKSVSVSPKVSHFFGGGGGGGEEGALADADGMRKGLSEHIWPDGRHVVTVDPDAYVDIPFVRTIRLPHQR